MKTDGLEIMLAGCVRLGINLPELVAACSLWASPEIFRHLQAENGFGVWYPNVRRARENNGETIGAIKDGIRLDDNTYANTALKQALTPGYRGFDNCVVCHVWLNSCYDHRYHTCIANLVLLPNALASLTDFDPQAQAALHFRSWELYGWHPQDEETPARPEGYPAAWRDPEAASADVWKRTRSRRSR
jgi:hypothetical protein